MGCRDSSTTLPGAPPRVDWKRAADGIGLCVFASFLLATTTGVLPWSFWFDAIALWPLLIMSLGIQIAFEKTRAPWLVLLGPMVVLAGLLFVADKGGPDVPAGPWKSAGPLPRPEGTRRVVLDFELFGSRLSVKARPLEAGALVDARSSEELLVSKLTVDSQDDAARVHLTTIRHRGVTILPGRKQVWDLGVPSELPARLELRGAMDSSRLDLAQGRFQGGTIDGAFLATQLTLPAAPEPVKIVQKGAFNALRLSVPEGTPVNVHGAGFPINLGKRRVAGEPGRAGYEVTIDGAFTAISIETRPPEPRPGPEAEPRKPEAEPTKPEAEPARPASPAPVRG